MANRKLTLEDRLHERFRALHVAEKHRDIILNELDQLKKKDEYTYRHSIRVGLYNAEAIKYVPLFNRNECIRGGLIFGLMHDAGKIDTPTELLRKTEEFTEEDMKIMEQHSLFGYQKLMKLGLRLTAEAVLRTHTYQNNSYPKDLPPFSIKDIHPAVVGLMYRYYFVVTAIVDHYDAISTRINGKNGKRMFTREEVQANLRKSFPDNRKFINLLYEQGVLGKEI